MRKPGELAAIPNPVIAGDDAHHSGESVAVMSGSDRHEAGSVKGCEALWSCWTPASVRRKRKRKNAVQSYRLGTQVRAVMPD